MKVAFTVSKYLESSRAAVAIKRLDVIYYLSATRDTQNDDTVVYKLCRKIKPGIHSFTIPFSTSPPELQPIAV